MYFTRLHTFLFSLFFLKSFLLTGCFTKKNGDFDENNSYNQAVSSLVLEARLISDYGEYQDAELIQYLSDVIKFALIANKISQPASLKILNSDEIIIGTPSAFHIFISCGALNKIQNEAQLVFILLHEVAHSILNHHININFIDPKTLELKADLLGLKMMSRAGYKTDEAQSAIMNFQGGHELGISTTHPRWYNRAASIAPYISNLGDEGRRRYIRFGYCKNKPLPKED